VLLVGGAAGAMCQNKVHAGFPALESKRTTAFSNKISASPLPPPSPPYPEHPSMMKDLTSTTDCGQRTCNEAELHQALSEVTGFILVGDSEHDKAPGNSGAKAKRAPSTNLKRKRAAIRNSNECSSSEASVKVQKV
jgi:hypothetical protein